MDLYLYPSVGAVYLSDPDNTPKPEQATTPELATPFIYYLVRKYRLRGMGSKGIFKISVPESDRLTKKIICMKDLHKYLRNDVTGDELKVSSPAFLTSIANELFMTNRSRKLNMIFVAYKTMMDDIRRLKAYKTLIRKIPPYTVIIKPINTERQLAFIADVAVKSRHLNIEFPKAEIYYRFLFGMKEELGEAVREMFINNVNFSNDPSDERTQTIKIDGAFVTLKSTINRVRMIFDMADMIRDAIVKEVPVAVMHALE